MQRTRLPKQWILKASLLALCFSVSSATLAADPLVVGATDPSTGYLQQIAEYTKGTLDAVNNIPSLINVNIQSWLMWSQPDTSDQTATLQADFTTYVNQSLQSVIPQPDLQKQILTDFFGKDITPTTLSYANDLTYQTLLGIPYFSPDPRDTNNSKVNSSYNYLLNASGVNIRHLLPDNSWTGNTRDQTAYLNFYRTVSSVQTYNAYVLSKMYADTQGGNAVSKTQSSLMQQATSPTWFSAIASEPVGIVLRQLLMFNSQIYILLSQMLEVQKQLLTAQAMNNTLLILSNGATEGILLQRAITKSPGT